MSLAVKLSFGVYCAVIRFVSFVVIASCTLNSNVCMGLQYTNILSIKVSVGATLNLEKLPGIDIHFWLRLSLHQNMAGHGTP